MKTDVPLLVFILALFALLYIYITDTEEAEGHQEKTKTEKWIQQWDTQANPEPAVYNE